MNEYWRVRDKTGAYFILVTEDVRPKPKTKTESDPQEYRNSSGKLIKLQYKLRVGSEEQKEIFKELGVTEKDRRKDYEVRNDDE